MAQSGSLVREKRCKIIVVGDPAVGKTSLIRQYADKKFADEYISTIGFEISKVIHVDPRDNETYSLLIWDLAGQPQFGQIRPRFYQGASAVIFMFDLTSQPSLYNIKDWYQEMASNIDGPTPACILVGNKLDLPRKIINPICRNKARELKMDYLEVSAKTGYNVRKVFDILMQRIKEIPSG
ncbi:MAG: Rab family GTPase [Candidatus Helarchaeota archaeon]